MVRFWPCRSVRHPSVEDRNVSQVEAAAGQDWKAAAWLLERRFPERWARHRRLPDEAPARDGLDELADRRAERRASG